MQYYSHCYILGTDTAGCYHHNNDKPHERKTKYIVRYECFIDIKSLTIYFSFCSYLELDLYIYIFYFIIIITFFAFNFYFQFFFIVLILFLFGVIVLISFVFVSFS